MTQYWFNVETRSVEEGPLSPAHERMGPYASREEAERAFAHAHERTQAWDEADRAWSGDDD